MNDKGQHQEQNPTKSKLQNSEHKLSAALEKFVVVQSKEIEMKGRELALKNEELEVRKQEISSNKEIALKSIEAQKEDRKEQANFFNRIEAKKLIFKCLVVIAVVVSLGMFIYSGNAKDAIELAKIGGGLLAGYLAGIFKGKFEALKHIAESRNQDD